MKVVLLFAAFVTAYAADCTEGPSTWCKSLDSAIECGAVNHCKDTVWKNLDLVEDSSDVCSFCESIMSDVQKFLQDQQKEAEIQDFLKSACSIIPEKSLQDKCSNLVENDLPILLLLISEELDPALICGAMGLCQNCDLFTAEPVVEQNLIVEPVDQVAAKGDICVDCKAFFGDIKAEITSETTEKELEQMLDQFCSSLGPLEDTCKDLIAQYVPELMQMLSDDFDPDMECQVLGFCQQSALTKVILPKLRLMKSSLYAQAKQNANDEMCDVCKDAINEAKSLLTNPDTEDEIEDFINQNLCSLLGDLSSVCTDTVKQYIPEILQLLDSQLDAEQDCTALGLCDEKAKPETFPLNEVLVSKITDDDLKSMRESGPKMTKVGDSTQCVLCEFVMTKLESMLTDNTTEHEIIAALDKVCSVLPSTISDECQNFVDTYGPAVLMLLTQEVSPQMVCTTLGLCSNAELKVSDGETCSVCKLLVSYVDSLLTQNATEAEIKQVLDKVCNFLPESYTQECVDTIAQYEPMLIQLLEKELTPTQVCTEIGVCTALEDLIVPTKAALLGDEECTWGPAYWCASKENASKCKAEAHCMKHVWN